jgi:hypothetical protein
VSAVAASRPMEGISQMVPQVVRSLLEMERGTRSRPSGAPSPNAPGPRVPEGTPPLTEPRPPRP